MFFFNQLKSVVNNWNLGKEKLLKQYTTNLRKNILRNNTGFTIRNNPQ